MIDSCQDWRANLSDENASPLFGKSDQPITSKMGWRTSVRTGCASLPPRNSSNFFIWLYYLLNVVYRCFGSHHFLPRLTLDWPWSAWTSIGMDLPVPLVSSQRESLRTPYVLRERVEGRSVSMKITWSFSSFKTKRHTALLSLLWPLRRRKSSPQD